MTVTLVVSWIAPITARQSKRRFTQHRDKRAGHADAGRLGRRGDAEIERPEHAEKATADGRTSSRSSANFSASGIASSSGGAGGASPGASDVRARM